MDSFKTDKINENDFYNEWYASDKNP
jgi:hypothetical protein